MRYSLSRLREDAQRAAKATTVHVPGADYEDLVQEAMLVMWLALSTGRVRYSDAGHISRSLATCGKNHLKQMARAARAAKRCPQDRYGRPLRFVDFEDVMPAYHVEDRVEDQSPAIPPCHPRGEDPEGYDPKDELCHNCPDKFSCLVETQTSGLTDATVADDPEVRLVVAAAGNKSQLALAHEVVMERMRRRIRLRTTKQPVPDELAVTSRIILPPAPTPNPGVPVPQGGSLGAPMPKKALKVPAKMPHPKTLSPAQMDQAMSRIKVGQPFPLEIGHVLVRRRKADEPDVCVELRENGFWLNLNGVTYGSLSSAAKAAECLFGASFAANRPGNAYFNIVRRYNTEIRDAATGAVLACRRGVR